MTPIERISQRAQAFTVLGVSASATKDDIRKAYRKLAFEKHPDRNPDTTEEFARIAEAYRFVSDNADALGIKEAATPAPPPAASESPRRVSRPQVPASETRFDDATLAECEALMEDEGGPGALHIATAVYRVGRSLTYFVPTALANGRNEVAVPTGMLTDTRHVLPRIIAFDRCETAGGLFEMPREYCDAYFPGARSIQIRFASA